MCNNFGNVHVNLQTKVKNTFDGVYWSGYLDVDVDDGVYDIKYTGKPDDYKDSEQIHLYNYIQGKNKKKGGYICAQRVYIRQKKGETYSEFKKRIKENIDVKFIHVKLDESIGKKFIEKGNEIVKRTHDIEYDNVEKYQKSGIWCYNCSYLKMCGGNPKGKLSKW